MTQQIAGLYAMLRGLLGGRGLRAAGRGVPQQKKVDEGISRAIREYREVFERLEKYDRS